ncbi:MAG: murein biosynthesis integral membrane protein MurJ [Treponema sp.]|nr:murein biosynthesis integral membrane protein MurJ [Treponema sp.]
MAKSKSRSSLLASGLSLSFFTLCSRILGLVREMTKASFLGTSSYADAFGIAFMIPNLFRRLFAENAISVAFIPTFRAYLEDCAQAEAKATDAAAGSDNSSAGTGTGAANSDAVRTTRDFLRATLTLVSFLTALVVMAGIAITPRIIPFFYSGDDGAVLSETTLLTRIMFPYLFVISVAAFFQGILNGVKIFAPSGFTPVLFNSIVITATYLLSPHTANPARAMSIGVLAGGTVQALFQLPFVLRTGWGCGFTTLKKAFTNPGTRRVMALIGPTIIGMAAYQLNDVVSTALAGRAGSGIVSSLQYSLRLQELILGIFAVSIGTVILPDMSALAKKQRWEAFNALLTQALKIIALISIPITFFSLVCGREIISLVYKSRSFDDNSVALTLSAFRYHIAGLFFIALNRIVAPAFYAQGNTKSPTLAGIIGFAVNIPLALLLVRPMAGGGIALALSLASAANSVVLFIFLRRTHASGVGSVIRALSLYALKMAVFSVAAALPAWFVRRALLTTFGGQLATHGRLIGYGLPLAASALVFAAVGLVLLALTGDSVFKALQGMVQRKLGRKLSH